MPPALDDKNPADIYGLPCSKLKKSHTPSSEHDEMISEPRSPMIPLTSEDPAPNQQSLPPLLNLSENVKFELQMIPISSKPDETSFHRPLPPLMDLPAELRNHIYRMCLLEIGTIGVTHQGLRTPHLLQVNRQIRNEASSIYYLENKFEFFFDGGDITIFETFSTSTGSADIIRRMHETRKVRMGLGAGAVCYWSSLLRLLEHYYHRRIPGPDEPRGLRPSKVDGAYHAFQMVKKLRGVLAWEHVAAALASYKAGAKVFGGNRGAWW